MVSVTNNAKFPREALDIQQCNKAVVFFVHLLLSLPIG
jgi:hypothetical protein